MDTDNIPAERIRYWKTHKVPSETDALPALKAGIAEVNRSRAADRLNRLILLTDGDLMRPDEVVRAAQRAGSDDIPIIALGVGADWNETLLQEIAQESGGVADYIAQPDEILTVFQNTVTSMQATVVQNAALSVRVASGIEVRKVWRVVPLIADLGRNPSVALGDIEKDTGQTLLVEFMLPARMPGNYRVAQVEVSYDIPALGVVGERAHADLLVRVAADNAQYPVNPRVMNIAERVTAFKLQTRALQDAQAGDNAAATQKLRSAATILGGMMTGLERRTATEYSFFAAVVVIPAAGVFYLYKVLPLLHAAHIPVFAIGTLVAFVSGWLAVKFLIQFLSRHSLVAFGWYRLPLALLVLWWWR